MPLQGLKLKGLPSKSFRPGNKPGVSEKVSIKLPVHLACLVRPDAPAEDKMKAISGGVAASPIERATLLFFLCYDKDQEIKSAALSAMRALPQAAVNDLYASPAIHPRMLQLLQKLYPVAIPAETAEDDSIESGEELEEESEEDATPSGEEEKEEEEEAYRSKYQLAQTMGVGQKIKMALTGDKEWRSLLIKDSNKLVNGAVVKNPRITEPEILTISKSVIQNDEIIRIICHNKEWVKNIEIRKALVLNHKTPLPVALRFMGFLSEKDLAGMAKSKNISSVLANQARRMLSSKKKS
jgi:hypothetical protein